MDGHLSVTSLTLNTAPPGPSRSQHDSAPIHSVGRLCPTASVSATVSLSPELRFVDRAGCRTPGGSRSQVGVFVTAASVRADDRLHTTGTRGSSGAAITTDSPFAPVENSALGDINLLDRFRRRREKRIPGGDKPTGSILRMRRGGPGPPITD